VYIATDPVKAAGACRTKAGDYGQLRKSKHINLLFQSRPLAFLAQIQIRLRQITNEQRAARAPSLQSPIPAVMGATVKARIVL